MKALILAAGMGSRISNKIKNLPKCLIKIGEETLLSRSLRLLFKNGVSSATVVVGYRAEDIINQIDLQNVNFVLNDKYRETNGIYSAYLARNIFDGKEDILVLSGDLFYDERVLKRVIESKKDPVLLTDGSRIEDADFRFYFENDVLLKYGKELSNDETSGECLGIAKLSCDFSKKYKTHLVKMIKDGICNLWWESVLYDLIGIDTIYVEDIKGLFWGEIDTYDDYLRISNYVNEKNSLAE